jgi:hypothetical protein
VREGVLEVLSSRRREVRLLEEELKEEAEVLHPEVRRF